MALALRAQAPAPAPPQTQRVDFARDIQPILEKNCYECHGRTKARGRLRIHPGQFILKGGASGTVIEPGHADQSLLMTRVTGSNGEDQMPLERDPLPPATIALLQAWIDRARLCLRRIRHRRLLTPPSRTTGSSSRAPTPPAGANSAWLRNRLTGRGRRLEREKLTPSGEADKATLLRRVTLTDRLPRRRPNSMPSSRIIHRRLRACRRIALTHSAAGARPCWAISTRTRTATRRTIAAASEMRDWVIDALNDDMPLIGSRSNRSPAMPPTRLRLKIAAASIATR